MHLVVSAQVKVHQPLEVKLMHNNPNMAYNVARFNIYPIVWARIAQR